MNERIVADVHLDPGRPRTADAFVALLVASGRDCSGLWLLGDIFEMWIGDDDDDGFTRHIVAELAATARRIPVRFVHGNRDFLIGPTFARETGIELLPESHVVRFGDTPIVLLHGDALCTDDVEYQAFRQMTRSTQWQADMRSRSLEERRAIGAALRARSAAESANKPSAIMDVNAVAVAECFTASDARVMVHGHVHRPARHVDAEGRRRWVLGDWDRCAWHLDWDRGGPRLVARSIRSPAARAP